jgi:membrane-associated protease RseP (regulator of RpoE activity)
VSDPLIEPAPVDPHLHEWPTLDEPARQKFQDRRYVHVLLLLLTVATTTCSGMGHYEAFTTGFSPAPSGLSTTQTILGGLWYSLTILAILGCHELGHYWACRYYDVDASRPFFLPVPLPLTGTLGAFIRIREPIPSKRMLFDIGIAGPIAGFLVAVPALIIGMAMSNVVELPSPLPPLTLYLGEPLLYKAVSWLFWGLPPDGYSVNMHPMAFAGWFGLLATALNLFPIGQLDGGHISYAVLGRRSSTVTLVMVVAALTLSYFSTSWVVWTGLMIVMLTIFGRHHPRTYDEDVPLDRTRSWLALFALIMFILCFSPVPIEVMRVMTP